MDLEKEYDRTDWMTVLDVMKMHDVGGKLMNEVEAFNEDAKVCNRVNRDK